MEYRATADGGPRPAAGKAPTVKSICINLGADAGGSFIRAEQTIILAKTLFYNDFSVVYGGVGVGLLGVLANAVLEFRGRSAGAFPGDFFTPAWRPGWAGLIVVGDGRERQRRLVELADAFLARPGGFGTPDDALALLARARFGEYRLPIAFFTVADYSRHLGRFLDRAGREGFISEEHRRLLVFEKDTDELLKTPYGIMARGVRRRFA